MSDDGYGLALSLDGQTADFVHGVECGRLWEQVKDPEAFDQTIHACNAEIVMRIMEAAGRSYTADESGDPAYLFLRVEGVES